MPVAKVDKSSKFDVVVKSLRRREIQCLVAAVSPQNPPNISLSSGDGSNLNGSSQLKKTPTKRSYVRRGLQWNGSEPKLSKSLLDFISPSTEALSPAANRIKRAYRKKSLGLAFSKPAGGSTSSLSTKSIVKSPTSNSNSELISSADRAVPKPSDDAPKKRSYRKKSLELASSKPTDGPASSLDTNKELSSAEKAAKSYDETPRKRTYRKKLDSSDPKKRSKSLLVISSNDDGSPSVVRIKRAYRKKNLGLEFSKPIDMPTSSLDSDSVVPKSNVDTPKKRQYRMKIPTVPHNTPVRCVPHSDTDSTCASSLSLYSASQSDKNMLASSSELPLMSIPMSDEESSRTSSAFSQDDLFASRRRRRRYWTQNFDFVNEEEEEPISEYELERQKKIEENRKMLRQILGDQCLLLGDCPRKSQDTPKVRKSYSKVPLPPPRPKSARIEVKRASNPIDFSKFEMLLLN